MILNPNEKFIIDLIFSKNKLDIKDIDFDEIVKIGSSHLILPLIYSKIKKKKISSLFPLDLMKYFNI